MKSYITNTIAMSKKSGILTALATATVLSTASVSAENSNIEVSKKIEQVSCATRLACETLSHSIQAELNKLTKKGLANLTSEEFVRYGELTQELIAVKDSTIAVENSKQKEQEITIKDNTEIMAQLSSIKGSLSILQDKNENVEKIFSLISGAES